MARGWFDRRVELKAVVDPEMNLAGLQDAELALTSTGSVTTAQELPAFAQQLSGAMVGTVWK